MVRRGSAGRWALDVASSAFSLVACTAAPGCLLCLVANMSLYSLLLLTLYSHYYKKSLRLYLLRLNSKPQALCGFSVLTRWAEQS